MALRMLSMSPPDEFCRGIPVFKRVIDEDFKLIDFIVPETWFTFDALNWDKTWLYDSPGSWSCDECFRKGQKFVANIKVYLMSIGLDTRIYLMSGQIAKPVVELVFTAVI